MRQFCNFVYKLVCSFLIKWIMISIIICDFDCVDGSLHHLIVYKPLEMDYNFENLNFLVNNDRNDLSIIKPVLVNESANPFYLIDRKNLNAFKHLMLNEQTPSIDYSQFNQVYQPNQLNQQIIQQFNQTQSNKSNLEIVPKTIDKSFILSNSFLVNDGESKSSKSSTNALKKIGIKISRFLSLPKFEAKSEAKSSLEFESEEESNEQNFAIKDDLTDSSNDSSYEDFNDNLDEESAYDTTDAQNAKSLIDKFSSYKDLIKNRIFNRIDSSDEDADAEFKQIYKLARFVEKNLRLIGLDQIEQLFAFNKTLTFKNLKNLNSLIGQINSKLEDNGDLFSMLTRIDKTNSDKIKRFDDEDGLNSLDLFREFEDYLSEKRKELRKRKKNMIKKLNDDHDYIISSINNKKNDLIKKSRKRRSRKMNIRRKSLNRSRRKYNRSKFNNKLKKQNKQTRKLDRSGRTGNKKMKLNHEKTSFQNCDLNDEECSEESEIHEQYVPFNQDDQQMSESYGASNQQDNQNDNQADDRYRNENNQNDNYNDNQQDYNQQQNYNEQDYDQQQSNYRPQDLRLKSNVKYEDSPSEHYESRPHDDHYSNGQNYESQPETSYEHPNQMSEYEYSGGEDLNAGQMLDDNEELNYRQPHNHHYISNYYEHPGTTEHPLISLKKLKLKHLNKHLHPHSDHSDGQHLEQGHHLQPHFGPPHSPHAAHPEPHPKDDLTLTKELITNLLFQNKHKLFAIFKATKLSHLLINKQIIAVIMKVFFGKSVYAKKKLILAAYKKCYIKIRTIDMLLIPVGVGTLLTPLFLPLAPLALILFGIVKLYTCCLCFLLAI